MRGTVSFCLALGRESTGRTPLVATAAVEAQIASCCCCSLCSASSCDRVTRCASTSGNRWPALRSPHEHLEQVPLVQTRSESWSCVDAAEKSRACHKVLWSTSRCKSLRLCMRYVCKESDGRKGPPARNKTKGQSHTYSTNQGYATQSEAEPTTQNPHTGLKTGPNHLGRGRDKTAHQGPASGTRRDARAAWRRPGQRSRTRGCA
jgi:hypothetical protein